MNAVERLNRLRSIGALGQSVWVDGFNRAMLRSGELSRFVEADGITGVVADLVAFGRGGAQGRKYDEDIATFAKHGRDTSAVGLCLADVQEAADLLRPVFDATSGDDGFVSVAVSPHVAHDTDAMLAEARTLWSTLARPNLMIAVPATAAGVPAIQDLVTDGINVNGTLIFGLGRYRQVSAAYLQGLTRRALRGLPLEGLASVASFCLSPIDALLDPRLEAMVAMGSDKAERLVGRIAVAIARLTWKRHRDLFEGDSFAGLAKRGARPQKLLWACTRARKPYTDFKYVEALIGAGTVTALAPETIAAFRNHGNAATRLSNSLDEAQAALANLASLGIDLGAVVAQLEADAVQKHTAAFDSTLDAVVVRRVETADTGQSREPVPVAGDGPSLRPG